MTTPICARRRLLRRMFCLGTAGAVLTGCWPDEHSQCVSAPENWDDHVIDFWGAPVLACPNGGQRGFEVLGQTRVEMTPADPDDLTSSSVVCACDSANGQRLSVTTTSVLPRYDVHVRYRSCANLDEACGLGSERIGSMTAYMNLNAAMPFCRHVDAGVQFCSLYYGIDADGLNRFCDENQLRESIRNCMLNHFSEDLVYARCEPGSRNPDCVREVTRAADPASGTQWDEGFNCIARAYRDIYDYPSAAVLAPYGGELDADGDGTCAFIDNCNNRGGDNGDPDQDGVPTACDNCPERMNAPPDGQRFQADADGDGVGDQCEEIHAEIHMGAPSRSLAVIKEQGGLYYDLRVPEAEQSPVTVDCDYTVQRIEQNGDLISSHTHQGCGSPYLGFWNGRDAAGAYVQPGRYVLRVEYYRYRSPNEPVVDATVVVPFLIYDLRVSPVGASNADLVANEPVQVFLDGDDDNQNGVIDSAEDLSFQEDDTVGLTYVALPADLAATLSIRRVDGGDARLWNPATRARVNLPNDAPPANLALEGTGVGDVVLTVRAVDGGQVLESEQRFRVVPPGANLQADSNRDGTVNDEDDAQEEVWNASAGAIFLPNLDVDANQCPRDAVLPESLVACSDASDEIVNLDADLADLARFNLAPWNDVPPDAEGRLQISPANAPVRLFQGTHAPYAHAADWTVMRPDVSRLSASDLRAGVAFAIEGTDIARDLEAWDGEITIELIVTRDPPPHVQRSQIFRDRVRMRVAPLVTQHTLDPVSVVFAREPNPTDGFRSQSLVTDMAAALDEAGLGGDATLQLIRDGDQWIQDHFEFAYASLPTVDEGQHIVFFAMTTATRLAKDEGGAEVYQHLRGVDVAGVMVGWTRKARSYDFMGNFETIPPYAQGGRRYPLGRALMGWSESLQQGWDVETRKLQAAQRVQPAVYLDSTWLEVGHVDETLQFIPTQVLNPCVPGARQDNCRGWVVLVQDPLLAIAMLHQAAARGAGDTALVSPNGEQLESKWGLIPGVTTIQAALNNEILMADSLEAARYIQDEVDVLRRETGIGDADIVPAPALYLRLEQGYLAFQAATTNGVMLTPMVYAAPDPHGPIVDGEDLYKVQLEAALAPFGVQVEWVEDWNNYHNANGEVHCGSNVLREVNLNEHWWEVTP